MSPYHIELVNLIHYFLFDLYSFLFSIVFPVELIKPFTDVFVELGLELSLKLFLGEDTGTSHVDEEEVLVVEDVVCYQNLEHASELIHTHSKQIDRLNEMLDDLRLEH